MNSGTYDNEAVIRIFQKLDKIKRMQLIAYLSYELTIYARDTYEPGTGGLLDPERLRGFNEMMHQLTGFILALIQGSDVVREERSFWKSLYELAEMYRCDKDLDSAIKNVVKSLDLQ